MLLLLLCPLGLCSGSRSLSKGFVLEELYNKAVLRRDYKVTTAVCQQNDFSLFVCTGSLLLGC